MKINIKRIYFKIKNIAQKTESHPLTKNKVFFALFRYISFNVIQNIYSKPRVYDWISNLKFYAQKGDAGIVGNIYFKLFDYEDSMFLMDHLNQKDLFVDVGANVGHYTLLAAGVCGCEVIAIEPIPSTFYKLNKNINLNDLNEKVKTFNIGIGQKKSLLNFTTNNDVMNSVAGENDKFVIKIEVKRLDDILENKNPVFLKIDVEGYEYFVLKGADEVLKNKSLKFILIEINGSSLKFGHTNKEIFELLISYNFIPIRYDVSHKKVNFVKSYNEDKFNTIFIRNKIN